MLHRNHTINTRPHRTALLAAIIGYTVGTLVGIAATRAWRSHQLAAALTDAASWQNDALHDPLTGLPNRRAAVAEVNQRLTATHTDTRPFLLALLDLDDFKTVNDTYGHSTGDELLTVVAARLHVAVQPDGFVARLGGDEFLVLLPHHDGDPADTLIPVLAQLDEPAPVGAATLRPHACVGVAVTTAGRANGWHQLMARADRALYRAKTNDGAVAVYDPHLDR